MSRIKETNSSLTDKCESFKSQSEEMKLKLDEINTEKSAQNQQNSTDLESLQGQLYEPIKQLEASIHDLVTQLDSNGQLQPDFTVLNLCYIRVKLSVYQSNVLLQVEIQSKLELFKNLVDSVSGMISQQGSLYTEINRNMEERESELIQLTSANEEKANLIESLNSQISELDAQLSGLKETNSSLNNDIENFKSQCEELRVKFEEINKEKFDQDQQHKIDVESIRSLQNELSTLNQQFEQSQNTINDLEAKLSENNEIQVNLKVVISF